MYHLQVFGKLENQNIKDHVESGVPMESISPVPKSTLIQDMKSLYEATQRKASGDIQFVSLPTSS